jgi:hypothetical protein
MLTELISSAEKRYKGIHICKLVVSLEDRDIQYGSFQSKFFP